MTFITKQSVAFNILNNVSEDSTAEYLEKGKRAQIGEIREWQGGKFRRTFDGWVPVKEGEGGKKEEQESEEKKESGGNIVDNVNNGEVINSLFKEWNSIKTPEQHKEWSKKVANTKFGTYEDKTILNVMNDFNPKFPNEIIKKDFINEIQEAYKNSGGSKEKEVDKYDLKSLVGKKAKDINGKDITIMSAFLAKDVKGFLDPKDKIKDTDILHVVKYDETGKISFMENKNIVQQEKEHKEAVDISIDKNSPYISKVNSSIESMVTKSEEKINQINDYTKKYTEKLEQFKKIIPSLEKAVSNYGGKISRLSYHKTGKDDTWENDDTFIVSFSITPTEKSKIKFIKDEGFTKEGRGKNDTKLETQAEKLRDYLKENLSLNSVSVNKYSFEQKDVSKGNILVDIWLNKDN